MRMLYLDDVRSPYSPRWDVVRSYDAFVVYVTEHGLPDAVSFDHDLAFEHYPFNEVNPDPNHIPYKNYVEKTGYDAAKWLVANYGVPAHWFVHSMNPVGRQNIINVLQDAEDKRA